ncbi:Unknown protein [Striga hermonthica]|uniref:Retrotransposon gag domain-containing protein n=1 Tax=Striga hermonthica TaxID=68872 RepID=A0A9N7NC30_STRHE|nr:Unknown protein [Striga hermonthica]
MMYGQKKQNRLSDLDDWWIIQSLITSWLLNVIDPSLCSPIPKKKVAVDLWDHLKQHFSICDGLRIQQLKMDLAECKQRHSSFEHYYGSLQKLWDNVRDSDTPPVTDLCAKCQVTMSAILERH